jgi:hypothetical protein
MREAERHLRAALNLLDAAPRESLPQDVRGYILQAGRAVMKADSDRAITLLDAALRALEDKPAPVGQ